MKANNHFLVDAISLLSAHPGCSRLTRGLCRVGTTGWYCSSSQSWAPQQAMHPAPAPRRATVPFLILGFHLSISSQATPRAKRK